MRSEKGELTAVCTPSQAEIALKATSIVDEKPKTASSESVVYSKEKIPQELLDKLHELKIGTSKRVIAAIEKHHISQAYGAAAYVENSYTSIVYPTEIFLKHLPNQPIEKLGQRHDPSILAKQIEEKKRIDEDRASPNYQAEANKTFAFIQQKLAKKIGATKTNSSTTRYF
ncbi:MAG: hypothetical protein AAGE96_09085 [Cyanobacteria bacterium P01_G01_bin.19]